MQFWYTILGMESGEKPKILIASPGMSINEMRSSSILPERGEKGPDFLQLQVDLLKLKDDPNPTREQELKLQRARLVNDAKQAGVFTTIKPLLLEIQTKYSYGEAYEKIDKLNISSFETEAEGRDGWKDSFGGMLEQYKEGALRNMEIAFFDATGDGKTDRAKEIQRERDLLGWSAPPEGLDILVRQGPSQRAGGIDTNALASEIAKAQGLLSPELYLEDYRDAEEYLRAPFQIVPGQEPRFWVILNDKEKEEWIVRSTLVITAYKKSMATGADKLYMDEMRELAVDLNKRALKVLFGAQQLVIDDETGKPKKGPDGKVERKVEYEGVDGVLPATGIYCTIIGDPKFLTHKDRDDLSLKDVLCRSVRGDSNLQKDLEMDYGPEILEQLQTDEKKLYEGCPDSFYHHDNSWGTDIGQESFRVLRKSVRHWLLTKGRSLLLTENELSNREAFFKVGEGGAFKTKRDLYDELKNRARDAEQIAWNFVYSTSVLECFDSRGYRPEGTKRHPPSSFWTLFQWVAMHPQERFEAKIARGAEAKEEWSALGTWGINNLTKNPSWKIVDADGRVKIEVPKDQRVLPDVLIRSALHTSMYQGAVREGFKTRYPDVKNETQTFFEIFNGVGNKVLFDTQNVNRKDLEGSINWQHFSDSPFVPFIFDEMRWADVVVNCFKKGEGAKIGMPDVSEAMRNLRLTKEQREKLLMTFFGVNANSPTLKPKESFVAWMAKKSALKEYYPNLFLEK